MTSEVTCKYHPKIPARWRCNHCQINFCSGCVPVSQTESIFPNCTLCRKSLVSLSIAEQIIPFWNNLSYFFSFPFNSLSLILIAIFSLMGLLSPAGWYGVIFNLALAFPVFKFSFIVMEKIANSENFDGDFKAIWASGQYGYFIRLLLSYGFVYFLLMKLITRIGDISFALISLAMVFAIPASLIILMMEKQFLSMLSPRKIIKVISLLGRDYFLLFLLSAVTAVISFLAITLEVNSNPLLIVFSRALSIYLLIVLFTMMGYLVLQYHFELNYSVNRVKTTMDKKSVLNNMTEIELFLQEGRYEDAQTALLNLVARSELNTQANEKLILLYAFQGKQSYVKKIAESYFLKLMSADKINKAADFYFQLTEKSIEYCPDDPVVALTMANAMKNIKQYQQALCLLKNYSSEAASNTYWDKMCFLKAELLAEFDNDYLSAISLLEQILKRSFNQSLLDKAEKYLSIIQLLNNK